MIKRRADLIQKHVTCAHEAGHGCAAVALGLRFMSIDIISSTGRRGGIIWPRNWLRDPWRLMQEEGNNKNPRIANLAKRRITTTFAGSPRSVASRLGPIFGGMPILIVPSPTCGCSERPSTIITRATVPALRRWSRAYGLIFRSSPANFSGEKF